MSEFEQMGKVMRELTFIADSGNKFFGSVQIQFFVQAGILFVRVVVFSDSEIFSVVVEIFELIYLFDVLVFKQYGVEDEIVFKFGFFGVFGGVFFQSVKFPEVVIGHF